MMTTTTTCTRHPRNKCTRCKRMRSCVGYAPIFDTITVTLSLYVRLYGMYMKFLNSLRLKVSRAHALNALPMSREIARTPERKSGCLALAHFTPSIIQANAIKVPTQRERERVGSSWVPTRPATTSQHQHQQHRQCSRVVVVDEICVVFRPYRPRNEWHCGINSGTRLMLTSDDEGIHQ